MKNVKLKNVQEINVLILLMEKSVMEEMNDVELGLGVIGIPANVLPM